MSSKILRKNSWECVHFIGDSSDDDIDMEVYPDRFFVAEVECRNIDSKFHLLDSISISLSFPSYFGHNFDALEDCLRDLESWLPAKGYVLIMRNSSVLWSSMPLVTGNLIETWLSVAQEWNNSGVPFHLVFADLR